MSESSFPIDFDTIHVRVHMYQSLVKEGPTMDYLPIPQFCLDFLLRPKIY